MEVYTIYKNPLDFPNDYVVKKWDCSVIPPIQDLNFIFINTDLEACRRELRDLRLENIGRHIYDDEVILENWI